MIKFFIVCVIRKLVTELTVLQAFLQHSGLCTLSLSLFPNPSHLKWPMGAHTIIFLGTRRPSSALHLHSLAPAVATYRLSSEHFGFSLWPYPRMQRMSMCMSRIYCMHWSPLPDHMPSTVRVPAQSRRFSCAHTSPSIRYSCIITTHMFSRRQHERALLLLHARLMASTYHNRHETWAGQPPQPLRSIRSRAPRVFEWSYVAATQPLPFDLLRRSRGRGCGLRCRRVRPRRRCRRWRRRRSCHRTPCGCAQTSRARAG